MSKCYIGFGKCSKYYLYILGHLICGILIDLGFYNQLDPRDNKGKIEYLGLSPELPKHPYIQFLYQYISLILGGSLFEFISKKNLKMRKIKLKILKLKIN